MQPRPAAANSPRDLVFIGAGGHALDLLDLVDAIDRQTGSHRRVRGFLDDAPAAQGTQRGGVPVLGPLAAAAAHLDCDFVACLGSPTSYARKESILARLPVPAAQWLTLIHPLAFVSPRSQVGRGCLIFPHVTINAGAVIGDQVLILPQTVISHDVVIGDHSTLAASVSLAGGVRVGRGAYLGSGALVRGEVTVGDGALVGMGSVVLHDVAPGAVVVGNPARLLRTAG